MSVPTPSSSPSTLNASAGGAVLDLADLSVAFTDGSEERVVLDHLDLRVAAGESVMVTGASGSGKSTLVTVASLMRRPTSGTVGLLGTDAATLRPKQVAEFRSDHIGIVFQTANLFGSLTAVEQVELVAHIRGRLDGAARRRARELLDAVGLADRADQLPGRLSGGERQRVGIARALMNEPELLLADEPTASLDPERGRDVMDILVRQATERGTAALIVTHAPEQVRGVTRHVHLDGGRLVEPGQLAATVSGAAGATVV